MVISLLFACFATLSLMSEFQILVNEWVLHRLILNIFLAIYGTGIHRSGIEVLPLTMTMLLNHAQINSICMALVEYLFQPHVVVWRLKLLLFDLLIQILKECLKPHINLL